MKKKILIIGDSGRGKTTLALKLSKKLGLPHYSTDDFFWKTKFSEKNDKAESIVSINKIYDTDRWVVDGGTRHLVNYGLEKADIILHLKFRNILSQYFSVIKRNLFKKDENLRELWGLLKHITYKKYKKGYGSSRGESIDEMVKPYKTKIINLYSFKDTDNYLNSLN